MRKKNQPGCPCCAGAAAIGCFPCGIPPVTLKSTFVDDWSTDGSGASLQLDLTYCNAFFLNSSSPHYWWSPAFNSFTHTCCVNQFAAHRFFLMCQAIQSGTNVIGRLATWTSSVSQQAALNAAQNGFNETCPASQSIFPNGTNTNYAYTSANCVAFALTLVRSTGSYAYTVHVTR